MIRSLSMAVRSLRARPARTLLTTLGIVLGVSVILAISIANLSTLDSLTAVFSEASGNAHLVVLSSSAGSEGFDERVQYKILNIGGVQSVVPTLHVKALPGTQTVSLDGGYLMGVELHLDLDVSSASPTKAKSWAKGRGAVFVNPFADRKPTADKTKLPTTDPIRYGCGPLLEAIR